MKGIAQQDLRTEVADLLRREGLNRAIGANGHEGGCLDVATGKADGCASGEAVGVVYCEFHGSLCAGSVASLFGLYSVIAVARCARCPPHRAVGSCSLDTPVNTSL